MTARESGAVGRPRKDAFRIPGEKPCTRCGVSQDLTEFPKNATTSDGLASWCYSCHREYGRKAYKKKQPMGDEMLRAIDRGPRSDDAIRRRNDSRYKSRRENGKPTCAYPGCISKINYKQGRLCMMHEQEMVQEKMARKLAKG